MTTITNFRHNDDDDDCNLLIFIIETKTKTEVWLTDDDQDKNSNNFVDGSEISTVNFNTEVGVISQHISPNTRFSRLWVLKCDKNWNNMLAIIQIGLNSH